MRVRSILPLLFAWWLLEDSWAQPFAPGPSLEWEEGIGELFVEPGEAPGALGVKESCEYLHVFLGWRC